MPLEWQPSLEELSTLLRDTFKLDHPTVKYKDEVNFFLFLQTQQNMHSTTTGW